MGAAAGEGSRRLYPYSGGFLRGDLRRILEAAGWQLCLGLPGREDRAVVWGRSSYAWRGEAVARWRGAGLVRVEDAFLRSVLPGRARGARGPLGLLIDPFGVHFDPSSPSLIDAMLARPSAGPSLLQCAQDGIARLIALDLSKYNNFWAEPPEPGYVLVIDQLRGDASAPDPAAFARMLAAARRENPEARIVIKGHAEAINGLRQGHFGRADCDARTLLCMEAVSPWRMLAGATTVYTVSSLMGYEAILAGHRPRVFGQPFYAGRGLSNDDAPPPGRAMIAPAALFAATHLLAPVWFDPCRGRMCSFEEAVDQLEAETRAWREDRLGYVAAGMRLWKRRAIQRFFGGGRAVRFVDPPPRAATIAAREGRGLLIWAGRASDDAHALRVEDGFLRSRGLGADLVPPLSLAIDPEGIYYDPARPSRLERLIAAPLPPGGEARAERLISGICAAGLTKYNLGGALPDLPAGRRILVPGQVEDDASIRCAAGAIHSNLALLQCVRAQNPDAVILYKPHPDVEAGLRPGALAAAQVLRYADLIMSRADPAALIEASDEIWTMTSLLGFEALLRGKPVAVTGAPFYAGWGLTRDLGDVPARRQARPGLAGLAHAALIGYPRYFDPVAARPCPPEVVLDLLQRPLRKPNRLLAKLQGALAPHAWLWR